ncbi:hypothetical protein ANANG_G00234430 [Anguilla anguilla]|uniref:tRNA-splicing endonuclease subunit Sen34 n=1 Tax=Anguilla anguilla TaxID=7936 RepID=A0A9D3RNG5_ANGAN|nr:hypothetical protein ANANG_G00234430 [Anguilla anguilla]
MDAHEKTGLEAAEEMVSSPARDGETHDETQKETAGGPAPGHRKIEVHFCGSTPLLWQAADVKAARETGVVGTLVGSLARQPRQNNRLGRPLELLTEEARLLRETAQAVLFPATTSTDAENLQAVEQYVERQERSYEEQRALALQERKAMLLRALAQKQEDAEEIESLDQSVQDRLDALERGFSLRPRDERSETRFRVFRDLSRQGFYLTSAGKFGGDYLVYPGDPLRFHAHFIAVCIPMDSPTPLCDLLALSRLGSNVKKTILLCSPSDGDEGGEEEEVVYTSLQWSGMV